MSSGTCLQLCWCFVLALCVVASVDSDARTDGFASSSVGRRCGGGPRSRRSTDVQFAVVIDAGSSGSRVRVYEWPADDGGRAMIAGGIRSIRPTLRIETGLAKIVENRTDVRDHIERLITDASRHIPPSHHDITPIYFMATAGESVPDLSSNIFIR